MDLTARKLLTIVTKAAPEDTLVRDIETLGARGYTITDARGKGSRGQRDATRCCVTPILPEPSAPRCASATTTTTPWSCTSVTWTCCVPRSSDLRKLN
jgi:hypothetical protein